MTWRNLQVGCGTLFAIFIAAFLLACAGQMWLVEFPIRLAAGWIDFSSANLPNVQVNFANVGMAAFFGAAFFGGLHWFLAWFVQARAEQDNGQTPNEQRPRTTWRVRWTVSIGAIVMLAFVAGTAMVGIAHQTIWMITDKSPILENSFGHVYRREELVYDLEQIGHAFDLFSDDKKSFPPAADRDASGRLLHGWQARLLPYIQDSQGPILHARIDFSRPWNDPINADVFRTPLRSVFARDRRGQLNDDGYALTTYSANSLVLGGDEAISLSDISDGLGNTILAGDISTDLPPWGRPGNSRNPTRGMDGAEGAFGSLESKGAVILMADGSVRFINREIDPKVLRALATPNGAEEISPSDW